LATELEKLGYKEGASFVIEERFAPGEPDRLFRYAEELVAANVEVIVAIGDPPARAALKATSNVPIVLVTGTDPVIAGFAKSMSRPGGQVTGVTLLSAEVEAKRLELLHEALPGNKRVSYLTVASRENQTMRPVENAARQLGVELHIVAVNSMADVKEAFAEIRRIGSTATIVGYHSLFASLDNSRVIAMEAEGAKQATVCEWPYMADAGCLFGYGADREDIYGPLASQIDRILRGETVGDLPFRQPQLLLLTVNLKTAKALGISVPASILARADQVID
jgi:putative ABC transport system substrate-binding protein